MLKPASRLVFLLLSAVAVLLLASCGVMPMSGRPGQAVPGSSVAASNCTATPFADGTTFVYVSTQSAVGEPYQVNAFSAAPDGSLTPVPESPMTLPGRPYVGAGSLVFGDDGYKIYSFRLHSDGCLSVENSLVAGRQENGLPFIGPGTLFLDPHDENLYSFDYDPPGGDSYFSSYSFNASNGQLTLVNQTQGSMAYDGGVLAFASNGGFAITADGSIRGGVLISEFQRSGNGALVPFGSGPFPTAPPGEFYDVTGAAATGTGHFIIAVQQHSTGQGLYNGANGPWQLAVYTIDDAGNLTTTSNWQNMVSPDIPDNSQDSSIHFSFSPDSRYFAISSFMALEVFSWDAASDTLTPIAAINNTEGSCQFGSGENGCTGSGFLNIAWDSNDHLYITLGQQLLVYSVMDTGITLAPGSPYTFQSPIGVAVISPKSN